ncbi:MAG: hypothetical protein IT198_03710 [Acidimicrobiia bacterium]|nr:hypothetical protein [Acidimicrobiia bacterium]
MTFDEDMRHPTPGVPLVIVDAVGRRLLPEVIRLLPWEPLDVCVSSDPWLLANDVRHAAEDGVRHFVCVGGDEVWLAVTAGTAGHEAVLVRHGGGPASIPRNFGLASEPERNTARLADPEPARLALDTIRVIPEDGTAVEVANGVWAGFGRRAGLWARAAGSWKVGLAVGGTSLYREDLCLSMGDVCHEVLASGVYVANGQFLGGLSIVPHAHPGDGKLDVLVFEGPAWDVWAMLPRLGLGTHLPHPRVKSFHPVAVHILGRGPLFADGHGVGRLPAQFTVQPGRLLVAV